MQRDIAVIADAIGSPSPIEALIGQVSLGKLGSYLFSGYGEMYGTTAMLLIQKGKNSAMVSDSSPSLRFSEFHDGVWVAGRIRGPESSSATTAMFMIQKEKSRAMCPVARHPFRFSEFHYGV